MYAEPQLSVLSVFQLAHKSQDAIESEVERVNDLASKANQLSAMFTSAEYSLAEHLFDQHLL